MDALTDIHATARALFLVKLANGALPQEIANGRLDGLRYFAIEIGGADFWLTEGGLLAPQTRDRALNG